MTKKLMSTEEVADYIGVKVSTIYQWTSQSYIPHIKLGRLIKFNPDAIDKWMEDQCIKGRITRDPDFPTAA